MRTYAPVLVTVYNRPIHFKNCIESLAKNFGASETSLFIAIDAPSREQDVKPNEEIVKYASEIKGFKQVHLFKRDYNIGARENAVRARNTLFADYSSLIMSEDDNVFSPYFLGFINQGLSLYQEEECVFSISGYNYPIPVPADYANDFYFAKAFSAWGVGIWRDKFEAVDFDTSLFYKDFINPLNLYQFNQSVGDHVFAHLLNSKMKREIYGDTAICYHLYQNNMLSLFPVTSLVRNTGHDGSGLHCGRLESDLFRKQPIWDKEHCPTISLSLVEEKRSFKELLAKHFKCSRFKSIAYYMLYLKLVALMRFKFLGD